ncbi:MAG: cysteine desulfurase [Clostridia bacterium]|nr:cysteine desulfurase [Clostridia bacterium]
MKGYLDNAATTQLCDESKNAIISALDCFGNPSSLHKLGQISSAQLESARANVANEIKADKSEIYFTSGGTESDNLAIRGAAMALKRRGNKIVTTAFEHAAVLSAMADLQKQGFEVVYLNPDESGTVPVSAFENAIDDKTILVSCMYINNETGAVLPVQSLKAIIKRKKSPAVLHCDATQAFGKYTLNPEKEGIDLMTLSAHKIHGPKGVGALYIKKGVRVLPITFGGGQEKTIRPGTEPLPLILGFAVAVESLGDKKANEQNALQIKEYLKNKLSEFDDVVINSPENSTAYILNFSVMGIRSETMLHFLEQKGVYVSSGSACSKGKASHVLSALNFNRDRIDSAVRVSFSRYSTVEDADMLYDAIKEARTSLIRSKR